MTPFSPLLTVIDTLSPVNIAAMFKYDDQTSSGSNSPGPPAGEGSSDRSYFTAVSGLFGDPGELLRGPGSDGPGKNDSKRQDDNQRRNHTERRNDDWDRDNLRHIVNSTLKILDDGGYFPPGQGGHYDLKEKIRWTNENTRYYGPGSGEGGEILESGFIAASKLYDANLKYRTGVQATVPPDPPKNATLDNIQTTIYVGEYSTLVGARRIHFSLARETDPSVNKRNGVLNFASAKIPGGEFMIGSQGQVRFLRMSYMIFT